MRHELARSTESGMVWRGIAEIIGAEVPAVANERRR
jgi:hypothetical protein